MSIKIYFKGMLIMRMIGISEWTALTLAKKYANKGCDCTIE